ncbi:MAG: glucose-6-phosphate isomerase [Candidatus Omnitrophica bacterium]|nr:glucose-6-phosphate isomerase [Candidatus Omnitrophota bacterium]
MSIRLDRDNLKGYVGQKDIEAISDKIRKVHDNLEQKKGAGAEFTGWCDLPTRISDDLIKELEDLGEEVRGYSDCIISIGIGGSYLGIRAAENFLRGTKIPIFYAGLNMSVDYHYQLLEKIKNHNPTVVVISKSGTTTEPALAFRLIQNALAEKYSQKEMKKRIICVTDESKGALRTIANKNGYRSYVIPDDVGGRFSLLTPVGLVPLALAGIDIKSMVEGAREGQRLYSKFDLKKNISYQYAASRYLLYKQNKVIEVSASFYDNLFYVLEWWKQLYGESEAKQGKGIFPASLIMSTDLHSMGQLMQDGMRNVFETFIQIEQPDHSIKLPSVDGDLDGFNIVAGKDLNYVNVQAHKATAAAHYEGQVPNMTLYIEKGDAYHFGQLIYFYERGVAISGYLLKINPFDQPGVEAYKKKMFALLGKK